MPVRSSMAALILRARRLCGNLPAAIADDQQVQNSLDAWRTEQRHTPLRPDPTFLPGGATQFLDFYSDTGDWEDDILLQDTSFNTLTADISEPTVGHWHFNAQPNGMAVRATGKTYDLYGACADLLDLWASQVMLEFDFSNDRDRYQRQQKFAQITQLADRYRALAGPRVMRATQSEAMPDHDGGGVVYSNVYGGGY